MVPEYCYRAKNLKGKIKAGLIQAIDEEQAYQSLKEEGFYITHIRQMQEHLNKKRLKSRYLADFSRNLSVMLESGIVLIQAVGILAQREKHPRLAKHYQKLNQDLVMGKPLSEALRQQNGSFPELMIGLFYAGEEGGNLKAAVQKAADYYEKEDKMRKRITGAMVYPGFLLALTILSAIAIFTTVLPGFFQLFETMEELPLSTRILVQFSKVFTDYGALCLAILTASLFIGAYVIGLPVMRQIKDRLLIKLPVIGKLLIPVYTARFARTLSALYSSGVPLVQAVITSAGAIGNAYIELQVDGIIEEVCSGRTLSESLEDVKGLDEKLAACVCIGEEAGNLNLMLDMAASGLDFEAEEAARQMTSLIEPSMIVILAVMIGFIMISVMIPVYQYYQSMGGIA